MATGSELHLIHPLGFDLSEKARRRAGLDYWPRLKVREHDSWGAYRAALPNARSWLFTTKAHRTVFEADLRVGDHLVFGKETAGLDQAVLAELPDRWVALPMAEGERSLNLATAVCAGVYEGLRQTWARGEVQIMRARIGMA